MSAICRWSLVVVVCFVTGVFVCYKGRSAGRRWNVWSTWEFACRFDVEDSSSPFSYSVGGRRDTFSGFGGMFPALFSSPTLLPVRRGLEWQTGVCRGSLPVAECCSSHGHLHCPSGVAPRRPTSRDSSGVDSPRGSVPRARQWSVAHWIIAPALST